MMKETKNLKRQSKTSEHIKVLPLKIETKSAATRKRNIFQVIHSQAVDLYV